MHTIGKAFRPIMIFDFAQKIKKQNTYCWTLFWVHLWIIHYPIGMIGVGQRMGFCNKLYHMHKNLHVVWVMAIIIIHKFNCARGQIWQYVIVELSMIRKYTKCKLIEDSSTIYMDNVGLLSLHHLHICNA